MVDINQAASSFLMFRALTENNMSFSDRYPPYLFTAPSKRFNIKTVGDIDNAITTVINETQEYKIALALSGGIDSAIIAKYLPKGTLAYTFRCLADDAIDETETAREYADICGLEHRVVDITWGDYLEFAPILMKHKGAPIHSIEPQIFKGALRAKADGVTHLIFGENADMIFGGMDGLVSKDWSFDEFVNRYTYILPETVLKNGIRLLAPYEKYRTESGIDFYSFITKYFYNEANGSYDNACSTAGVVYISPFNRMILDAPLDYERIRNGESKYMLRELFRNLYNVSEVPQKTPMPRPLKQWLKDWAGPKRSEFFPSCIAGLNSDQKWMVFVLEMFLNLLEE